MNTIGENMEKYVPTIIQYENHTYVGFIDEKQLKHPRYYRKLIGTRGYRLRDLERYACGDKIYKMSLELYFQLSSEIRKFASTVNYKYNLNKFRHELNDRK